MKSKVAGDGSQLSADDELGKASSDLSLVGKGEGGRLANASAPYCSCDTNHSGPQLIPEKKTDLRDTNVGFRLPRWRNQCRNRSGMTESGLQGSIIKES